MRILLTNDDGIDAPGFAVLQRIAATLSDDVWISAPLHEQSAKGRSITLQEPLRAFPVGERGWAVSGTPTDCVLLAVNDLMPSPPDLILSGVNRGQNLADDTTMSGTVAGALQGMAMGVPSIALSQSLGDFTDGHPIPWDTSEHFAPGIIQHLLEAGWPPDVILNINFPDRTPDQVKGVEVTRQGQRDVHHMHAERRTDLRGRPYFWMGFRGGEAEPPAGTDLHAIAEGKISVTPLHIDLTHQVTLNRLKGVLGGVPPRFNAPVRAL